MVDFKSKRFIILEQELSNLKQHFLPEKFDPEGNYSERQIALTIAYRVLAHAEIEAYIEERVLEIAQNSLHIWKTQKQTTLTLVSLFAFSGLTLEKPPNSLTPKQPSESEKLKFDNKLGKVFNSFRTSVKDNHGIREKNILSLLLPIGIDSEEIDKIWLQEIDDFGQKRGEFAHQSASKYKTSQPPDPKNELDTVNRLLIGLINIDNLLNYLLTP